MDNVNENGIPQFEANLSSMQADDFVVLNYSGTDVDIATELSDVHLSDNHQHTMLDEKNLIQSWELLKEENTNLKDQIKKMNQLLTKRIEEMKEMKSAQGKWMEMNEANHQRAKEEILSLQEDNEKFKHRIESILEELGQIIKKQKDPECKKYLEDISLQIKEGVQLQTKEGVRTETEEGVQSGAKEGVQSETKERVQSEAKEEVQSEAKEGLQSEATSDVHVTKLNLIIAEMSEQLKCKDEQIDLIARELSEMKEKPKKLTDMVLVSGETKTETPKESSHESLESFQEELTSVRGELNKVTSINTQLNEDITSLQKLRTRNHSEIEALKADAIKYQQMQEEKSKEFDKLRANIAKLQTDKDELEHSLVYHQQHQCPAAMQENTTKSPLSDSQPPIPSSTDVMVGSAPSTGGKSYRREPSSEDGETVQNLMIIFRAERQKCASLQEKLTSESKRVHDLEMELLITQQELQTRNSKLGKSEREHNVIVEDLNRKLDNLSKEFQNFVEEPRYQSTGEDIRALRSQVMALVAELEEMNKQVEDANIQVQKRNERIKNLELKNSVLASEQYNQGMQDTAIIDRLQMEIKRLSEETNGYAEVVEERNDLLIKYQNLQAVHKDVYHKYEEARHKVVDEKEIEELTVKLISSEEALEKKDYQLRQLQDNVKHLQQFEDQFAALRAQAEVYKMDFEAEREAREKAHSEKERLMERIKQQEEEIEQMKEDLNPARKAALENLQRRYGTSQPQQMHISQHMMAQDIGPMYGPPGDYYPHAMGGQHHMALPPPQSPQHLCPVCQRNFPDIDTLQIHVMDCIN